VYSGFVPRPHLAGLLDDYGRWGRANALVHRTGLRPASWSYLRARSAAFRFARELEARGVGRGDRVLFLSEDGPEWVVAFLAGILRGVVAVPLDPESSPEFVGRVLQQVRPRLALADRPVPSVPTLCLPDLEREVAARSPEPVAPPDLGRDDLLEIVFTSGTTAEPKGVCLTHGNILANLQPVEDEVAKHPRLVRLTRPLRFLSLVPLTHVYGQLAAVFVPPVLGAEAHFPPSLKTSEIVDAIRRGRIGVLVAVPRQLELLREAVEREWRSRGVLEARRAGLTVAEPLPFWRRLWAFRDVHRRFGWRFLVLATGGATLGRDTEAFWRRLGYVVMQGYGMTETAALVTLVNPFKSTAGSIGEALPGTEVRVDEKGQVLVRGPSVSPGYWRDGPERLTDSEGWLATGDLVRQEADGSFRFQGRDKDLIVTAAGLNLYPADLEAALDRQPGVRGSAVVGVEGPQGPEPVAVLLLRAGTDAAEVVRQANEVLGPHQQMRRWLVWPEPDFPRTPATGKVRKALLAEELRRWGPGATARGAPPPGRGALAELIASVGGEPPADRGASLGEGAKLDSLARVELAAALEERFQVEIDEAALTPATTVAEVEALVTEGTSGPPVPYPYPDWAQRPPVAWLRPLVRESLLLPVTRLLCPVTVVGGERLAGLDAPVLLVANHVTMVDPVLLLAALPRRLRHVAVAMDGELLRRYRHPSLAAGARERLGGPPAYAILVTLLNVFSLPKKSGFRKSFAFAGESVERGYGILVFPEGVRTRDGAMSPFLPGIGLLAQGLRLPVLPAFIRGLFALKAGRRSARRGEVQVVFGDPVLYEPGRDPSELAKDLERRVAALEER
jgi:long-chain acyl-CoA synthetase